MVHRFDTEKLASFLCSSSKIDGQDYLFIRGKSKVLKYIIITGLDSGFDSIEKKDSTKFIVSDLLEKFESEEKYWPRTEKLISYIFDIQGVSYDFINIDENHQANGIKVSLVNYLNNEIFSDGHKVDTYGKISKVIKKFNYKNLDDNDKEKLLGLLKRDQELLGLVKVEELQKDNVIGILDDMFSTNPHIYYRITTKFQEN